MAQITIEPFVMRNVDLTIGTDEYKSHVATVRLVPTTPTVSWGGLDGTSGRTFPGVTTWVAEIGYAQDFATANSLARYLHEHEGETVPFVFKPVSGDPGASADVVIVPGAIGGDINTVATSTVTLPVDGKPDLDAVA